MSDDLDKLAADLAAAGKQAVARAYDAVEKNAQQLQREWRSNARKTARKTGKSYPKSITNEQLPTPGAATWQVGPQYGIGQGSMGAGFEYGSVNQPPHLDGARAAANVEPKLVKDLKDILKDFM